MIYKTIESKHSVWVSQEPSFDKIKLNFIKKKGGSKFEKDFKIKNRFIDYDHAISIWLLDGISSGFESIVDEVKNACKGYIGDDDITYIYALEEFEYDACIQENDTLKFLGNITLHLKIRDWNAERREIEGY
ncbi:hypothetical protein F6Q07_16685 [Pectobacterium parmentieri]|uniref:Uncharacterized protein n=1 Tax=Pectobacterium parmentieri TaxID=1905730 RepID=A0A8B3FMH9_PECPM|nr:hypothetical protein [Pectobacterium parmentieri]AOR60498.1 hypothetical protein A8F97_16590 [Pectobacterium parmentieri]AYG99823.1 hypothetical protein C5E26_01970 [Pectobacterium parmentieri]AYH04282.1 hypothetical protein C5E25_02205 [Pectobacterium parmentieri]AYH08563.1 hypothetical protein C5E24_01855 [Pectobacterium parmentieri]AYH13104.1 hypothetical protein C5E23_02190 [Pectobacterium parmentieri]